MVVVRVSRALEDVGRAVMVTTGRAVVGMVVVEMAVAVVMAGIAAVVEAPDIGLDISDSRLLELLGWHRK